MEAIRNLFAALFLASIGMLIHVHFLWNHVDILLASVILVVVIKTVVVTMVIKAFGYSTRTSFLVSITDSTFLIELNNCWSSNDLAFLYLPFTFTLFDRKGGFVISSNWWICICSLESCLKSSSCWGNFSHLLMITECTRYHVLLLVLFTTTCLDFHFQIMDS